MPTCLSRVNVTIRESHRHIVFIHNLPTYSTYDGGVRVMTQRNLLCKLTESKPLRVRPYISIAHGAVDVLCGLVIACRKFERS